MLIHICHKDSSFDMLIFLLFLIYPNISAIFRRNYLLLLTQLFHKDISLTLTASLSQILDIALIPTEEK